MAWHMGAAVVSSTADEAGDDAWNHGVRGVSNAIDRCRLGTRLPMTAMKRRHSKPTTPPPRNPVALALGARRSSGAAGRHGPKAGARRAAERRALRRELQAGDRN